MSVIKIERPRQYINMLRDYRIFIDGQKAGAIATGETKEFVTTPGPHKLIAKIDWCSSPEISFTLNNDETKLIQVGGAKYIPRVALVIMGALLISSFAQYLLNYDRKFSHILSYFLLLFMFYVFTLGSKRYLSLVEM